MMVEIHNVRVAKKLRFGEVFCGSAGGWVDRWVGGGNSFAGLRDSITF